MMRAAATIARYTLLEALRNRLLWLLLILALGAVAVSGFLNALALTESRQLQAALLGAVLRLAAVFLIATFVVTSMAREASDKGLELLLALPVPRAVYLFGKLAGYAALAVLPAAPDDYLRWPCEYQAESEMPPQPALSVPSTPSAPFPSPAPLTA